jgi:hypothetical protein
LRGFISRDSAIAFSNLSAVYGFGRNDFTPACAASSIQSFPLSPLTAMILTFGSSRCNARIVAEPSITGLENF